MSHRREERLAELALSYEISIIEGNDLVRYRTTARGPLAEVLEESARLAVAYDADRVFYVRQAQRIPPPPAGRTYEWYVGDAIERGPVNRLIVTRDVHGAQLLEEALG